MPRELERSIRQRRKRSGILLPIIEDRMRRPLQIEDEDDVNFIQDLAMKQALRETERKSSDKPMFSPSALAQCMRKVYLMRHWKELGLQRIEPIRPSANYYFMTGNWTHLKWQFVIYKIDKEGHPDLELIGNEIPVTSKHGDHGGTLDTLLRLYGEPFVVDWKGLNVRDFSKVAAGAIPVQYEIQAVDYGFLANVQHRPRILKPGEKVERVLLMAESKGGPTPKYPIALCEQEIFLDEVAPRIQKRMEVLRQHEAKEKVPEPECISTTEFQFTGCPFQKFCKEEVAAIQRAAKSLEPSGFKVSRPSTKRRKISR